MQSPAQHHDQALQLLFIELRVGLARSAIQAGMILNGIAATVVLAFLASLVRTPAGGVIQAEASQLKMATAVFGIGAFLAAITFVNAYVAQGAIASGRSSALGNGLRRLGLALIIGSLGSFPLGVTIVLDAILII
jgi:hypothetical protein